MATMEADIKDLKTENDKYKTDSDKEITKLKETIEGQIAEIVELNEKKQTVT